MSQKSFNVILENALKIPGWTSEAELRWLAEQAREHSRIVEIGSWKGRSTRALADNTLGYVVAVDTWEGTPEDGHSKELADKPEGWLFDQFVSNTEGCYAIPIRLPSIEAAKDCRIAFDMIFIDAAHDYENVKADILAWLPLLAPGGLICGHDFDAGRPGVVKAVRELFPNPRLAVGSIWVGQ